MLLTRTPLYSRGYPRSLVRLACVRHAASVDSEPGSNSRLKSAHAQGTGALHANSVSYPAGMTSRRFTRPAPAEGTQRVAQLASRLNIRRLETQPHGIQTHTIDVACSTQLSKNSLLRRVYCGAPKSGVSRLDLRGQPQVACPVTKMVSGQFSMLRNKSTLVNRATKIFFPSRNTSSY